MTGVLPVALERATRAITPVVHSVKEYICVMQLHGEVDEKELEKVAKYFIGRIYQRPPVRSSVKRALRIRRIYSIDVIEFTDKLVLMKVSCESGTYIRKLCHDMGILLGVGAHMRELRRVRTGPFTEKDCITLHRLSEAVYLWRNEGYEDDLRKLIIPIEKAMCNLPKIVVKDTAVAAVAHGASLSIRGVAALTNDVRRNRIVALLTMKGELIGLGRAEVSADKAKSSNKGIIATPKRIIIDRELYPKVWGVKRH